MYFKQLEEKWKIMPKFFLNKRDIKILIENPIIILFFFAIGILFGLYLLIIEYFSDMIYFIIKYRVLIFMLIISVIVTLFIKYLITRQIGETIRNENKENLILIESLNNQYSSNYIKIDYNREIIINYQSKYDFEKIEPEDILYNQVKTHNYIKVIEDIKSNNNQYKKYIQLFDDIITKINKSKYKKIYLSNEKFIEYSKGYLRNRLVKKPQMYFELHIKTIYETPTGRNKYTKSKNFYEKDIYNTIEQIKNDDLYRQTYEFHKLNERSKMSNKLRFEVFKRDKYTCKICGRKQSDGVKLHVDHINPVSKGGKTLFENLQTLCDSCNLGKSNNYM